jgi:hypothetical protein
MVNQSHVYYETFNRYHPNSFHSDIARLVACLTCLRNRHEHEDEGRLTPNDYLTVYAEASHYMADDSMAKASRSYDAAIAALSAVVRDRVRSARDGTRQYEAQRRRQAREAWTLSDASASTNWTNLDFTSATTDTNEYVYNWQGVTDDNESSEDGHDFEIDMPESLGEAGEDVPEAGIAEGDPIMQDSGGNLRSWTSMGRRLGRRGVETLLGTLRELDEQTQETTAMVDELGNVLSSLQLRLPHVERMHDSSHVVYMGDGSGHDAMILPPDEPIEVAVMLPTHLLNVA